MEKVLFIQTGGTIDKDYPHTERGWAFEITEPAVIAILSKLDPSFDFEVISAMRKDSLEITDKDREALLLLIQGRKEKRIVITHGSDTIIESAMYLNNRMVDKLIIFTGAMRPAKFSNTDAEINLGTAIGGVNVLKKGVYIAMSGVVVSADKIDRDQKTGKFY